MYRPDRKYRSRRYFTHRYQDETSVYDTTSEKWFNGDGYSCWCYVRVPVAFRGHKDKIERFLDHHVEDVEAWATPEEIKEWHEQPENRKHAGRRGILALGPRYPGQTCAQDG